MSCKRTARRPPRLVEVVIDSLAFGGDGVGRDVDGRVVFVPGAAPGDRVEARVVEEKKDFARAELARLIAPGAARVEPPCPIFRDGDCGGCQWQHVSIEAQRAAKEEIVRRALRHATAAVEPIATPAPPYRWRRRARLRWRRGVVGYAARRSHRLVDVDACPQMEEGLEAALVGERERLRARPEVAGGAGELHLLLGRRGVVHVVARGGGLDERSGPAIDLGDEEAPFWAEADVFAQVSAPGNELLRRLVREAVGEADGGRALELHAGSGNFTRDLAAAFAEVLAVEESPAASALAARNLAARGLAERVTWRTAPAVAAVADLGGERFDAVLVDPPRTGLEPGLPAALAALGARRVVYVSCDPNTLARDLGAFAGYRVTRATPVDLMPQTYHVEVVAVLDREVA